MPPWLQALTLGLLNQLSKVILTCIQVWGPPFWKMITKSEAAETELIRKTPVSAHVCTLLLRRI